ncbi:hypothetical protein COJ46_22240 [Bacillus sp. AFS077874]|uniref:sortase domain-containing protein n=1 Tax=Bacillus sp. AFS077874 TaxID=2033513 RepID=UPI000BFA8A55|nr:hypothetical protein COJ46_22240 [Bacillus sp. AFS077874]
MGDFVFFSNEEKTFIYQVIEKYVISSDYIEAIEDKKDDPIIPLITCHSNGTKR